MGLFAELLHERTGQELARGRIWRIETALNPLLKARGLNSLDRLAADIRAGRDETLAAAVVDALLNNETYFFRDLPAFRLLCEQALGRIAAERRASRRLRIWCAGCSTGQEVYTIAMLLAAEPQKWDGWTIDIVGSDVSGAAIAQARSGSYSHFEIQRGLPVREMVRWFDADGERWRAKAVLREQVRFSVANLLDPPRTPLRSDVILCRNLLFYLSPAKRQIVFERLAAALGDDGVLMLGAGETVLGQTRSFEPDPAGRGLYRRTSRQEAGRAQPVNASARWM